MATRQELVYPADPPHSTGKDNITTIARGGTNTLYGRKQSTAKNNCATLHQETTKPRSRSEDIATSMGNTVLGQGHLYGWRGQ